MNYNDERLLEVEQERDDALAKADQTYGEMIANSDKYYDSMIQQSENYQKEQTALQEEKTAHTINKIEQQKDQLHKDYLKEQSAAYVDWQKQTDPHGVQAEAMAEQGMRNTGYRESSLVSMYNAYQNRVATARESYTTAVMNYDNSIKDAMLQNSSVLAEIAHNAFVEQAQLALEAFQNKNQLIQNKFNAELSLKNYYSGEYQNVLDQINAERSFNESVRQFDAEMAYKQQQLDLQKAKQDAELAYQSQLLQLQQPTQQPSITPTTNNATTNQEKMLADKENAFDAQYDIDIASLSASGYSRSLSTKEIADLLEEGYLVKEIVGNKIVFKPGPKDARKDPRSLWYKSTTQEKKTGGSGGKFGSSGSTNSQIN